MQQNTHTGDAAISPLPMSSPSRRLQSAVNEFIQQSASEHCAVDVTMNGEWCVFEGTVDSHWTRAMLFSLAPKTGGQRYIIDKLQVRPVLAAKGDS
ncbi:MAG: hypothetical protein JXX29_16935 [Deltaproteobacteria bacterium]|nr:hypothetical protein [Deltaproteobacteria bacterium]MBN2673372.1 hypothetical protein [Deltaproteobacteria bacterium]